MLVIYIVSKNDVKNFCNQLFKYIKIIINILTILKLFK